MRDVVIDIFWVVASIISIGLNVRLFQLLLQPNAMPTSAQCATRDPTPARPATINIQRDIDELPHFRGMLSHVILKVDDSPKDQDDLRRVFTYWAKYPPCLLASNPTSWTFTQVTLSLLLQNSPSNETATVLRDLFNELPVTVRACFKSFEIRQAGITTDDTPVNELKNSRALFSALISNRVKLENPNHVFLMDTTCVPIHSNWLNHIDARTRPPNEPYWMMGSVYRGFRDPSWRKDLASFAHIGRYAIYNLADPTFAEWYLQRVKRYIERTPLPDYPFGRWDMDIFSYIADLGQTFDFQSTSAKMRYTNTILNQWNITINRAAIISQDPDVVIVCGIVPPLTTHL